MTLFEKYDAANKFHTTSFILIELVDRLQNFAVIDHGARHPNDVYCVFSLWYIALHAVRATALQWDLALFLEYVL